MTRPLTGCDRLLYLFLKLREKDEEADAAIVEALSHSTWFTHVMLVVPSWQEFPDAARHPLVQRVADICALSHIGLIWGRWLWVAWPEGVERPPSNISDLDSAHYAAFIATVNAEARALGAIGTMCDAEPYGNSTQKELKSAVLVGNDRLRIGRAIAGAARYVGRVDLIRPVSSSRPTHYSWVIGALGDLRLDSKTYCATGPDQLDKINPPNGYIHELHYWGQWVGLGGDEDVLGGKAMVTVHDVKGLDFTAIRTVYPECRGLWIHANHEDMPEVLRAFG